MSTDALEQTVVEPAVETTPEASRSSGGHRAEAPATTATDDAGEESES